ncbi:MAG: chromate transporter [Oscillospiraceae bacterium]|nr:chromate transporter [Oscillospiraceae bacterium]
MSAKRDVKTYWKLFSSTFCLSAFTFGGGYIIIPLMRKKFVEELHWIEEQEMLDLSAIAQSSPGAIAVNAAILVGYRIAGIPGALVTICGTILPPLIILSIISVIYGWFRSNPWVAALLKGMQSGVAAVIADVTIRMAGDVIRQKKLLYILIMAGAFCATFFLKINVVYIILSCVLLGLIAALLAKRREAKAP